MKTFEHLPAKTKEISLLKDQAEKTTGPENAAINQKIISKTRPDSSKPTR